MTHTLHDFDHWSMEDWLVGAMRHQFKTVVFRVIMYGHGQDYGPLNVFGVLLQSVVIPGITV